jgi:hypothetical protein
MNVKASVVVLVSLFLACQRPTGQAAHLGPELVEAGPGPVADLVGRAQEKAKRDGHQLLVYVSATWCEPCERFQKALRAGELNVQFPRLRLFKLDSDRDLARLRAAGYDGEFIPRFVVPGPDGRGTNRRFEGVARGQETVSASIGPRLRELLADPVL